MSILFPVRKVTSSGNYLARTSSHVGLRSFAAPACSALDCSIKSVPGVDDWDLWIRIASLYQVMAVAQPIMVWRKSTPISGQGTSHADEMATLSTDLFHQKWLKLNRVAEAPAWKRRQIKRQFSRNMASHLVFATARALVAGHFRGVQKNVLAALRLHPYASVRATATYTLRFLSGSARGGFSLAGFDTGFMHDERTKCNR